MFCESHTYDESDLYCEITPSGTDLMFEEFTDLYKAPRNASVLNKPVKNTLDSYELSWLAEALSRHLLPLGMPTLKLA